MISRYDLSEAAYQDARRAFEDAIKLAGGQTKFAEFCGCSQGNISQLMAKGSLLPSRYASKVEAGLGVSRERLRPDVFTAARNHDAEVSSGTIHVPCNPAPVLPKAPAND